MRRPAVLVLALIVLLAPAPLLGQTSVDDALKGFDEDEAETNPAHDPLDDVLKGFDDQADKPQTASSGARAEAEEPARLSWGGSLAEELSYNHAHYAPSAGQPDYRGLSSVKTRLDLDADYRFDGGWKGRLGGHAFYDAAYRFRGRDDYRAGFLDSYESEAEIGEAFVEGPLSKAVDLKVGRQIVVWGKADTLRVTDLLNPLDLRLPGRTDVDDLRLPQFMSKLSYHRGPWTASATLVHEARYNKTVVPGSDFFPLTVALPPERKPSRSFNNQEIGLALDGVFSGWDLSLYAASVFNDQPHVALEGDGLVRNHTRLGMFGLAANVASGNWLWKAEGAYLDGFKFSGAPGEKFARLDALAGVEFAGLTDTTISLEVVNRRLLDFDARLSGTPEDGRRSDFQSALRLTRSFFNETLDLVFLASTHGLDGGNGAVQRLQAAYDVNDSLVITGGLISYLNGDKQSFSNVGRNDRLFVEFVFHF
jgi:hypothetical protein